MTGEGFGMLGQQNTGTLKIDRKKQKQNLSKVQLTQQKNKNSCWPIKFTLE